MNANILKLTTCLAWAGMAISSAGPVNAEAITSQVGNFAACANSYVNYIQNHCPYADGGELLYTWQTSYRQQIKFSTSPCNSGGCSQDTSDVWVGSIYPVGRKAVAGSEVLCGAKYLYTLGDCAC